MALHLQLLAGWCTFTDVSRETKGTFIEKLAVRVKPLKFSNDTLVQLQSV